jgi:predicted NBD/HSP70 family sugar kinase
VIGLELLDAAVIAVIVDDEGRVSQRVEARAADVPAAALMAIDRIGGDPTSRVAVAAAGPDSASSVNALAAIRGRLGGRCQAGAPAASGPAAAVAEAWTGAARDKRDVVFFAVGSHVWAGVLRAGAPMGGASRAPAVGWLALNPVEREDYRKVGCLEAEVAAAGIVRRLVWRVKAGDRSRVQDAVAGDLGAISLEHVLEAARGGDGVAISVMRDTAKYLGMAAANLAVIADPEVLVLGGIMASAADLLLDAVRTEFARRVPAAMAQALTIVPATLGADAPAIGAVRLASPGTS